MTELEKELFACRDEEYRAFQSALAEKLRALSIENTGTDGISNINAEIDAEDVTIYNLQGVRQSRLQKGINIVNGKKIVVK